MRLRVILSGALLLWPVLCAASTEAPSWVQEIASRAVPKFEAKVPVVALLNEQHVTVDAAGRVTTDYREAIKILTREGRNKGEAAIPYLAASDKVRDVHAWLVAPNGFVKTYTPKDGIFDVGAVDESLYDEIRFRSSRADNPEIGSVFVFEGRLESKPFLSQESFEFQDRAFPALESRFVLSLPAGWIAKGVVFNHDPVAPVVDGSTYTWELKDLPFREREPAGPSIYGAMPRLAVDYTPPPGVTSPAPCFRNWQDASRYLTDLSAGQDDPSDDLAAKAKELTASKTTEYEKIQAIGHYVQKVKYVSIQMNLAKGGGYRPHTAESVFAKQYGDCKDKANLMRAMLRSVGIPSYLVVIYAGDRTVVQEAWPSPEQFNHAIIGVHVGDAVQAPTVLDAPGVGRLLIFDPTNDQTPVGDLPFYLQGSLALLEAGDKGSLLRMPVMPPDASAANVSVDAALSNTGQLTAKVEQNNTGQSAVRERATLSELKPEDRQKRIERWVSETAEGAAIANVKEDDDFGQNHFHLHLELSAATYGQLMQGRLLVFNPAVIGRQSRLYLREETRREPLILNAESYHKSVRIRLPEGFTVDEMPDCGKLATSFASFACSVKQEPGAVVLTQDLSTQAVTIPPEEYIKARKFFNAIAGFEEQPIVLVKN
ncbi:MAG: transglutaminase domain-containing protein [Bryobacteraceae bacterium]